MIKIGGFGMIWKDLGDFSAKPTEGVPCGQKSYKSGQIITNNYFQTSNFKTQRLWFNFKFNLNDSFQTLISNSMFNYLNFNFNLR